LYILDVVHNILNDGDPENFSSSGKSHIDIGIYFLLIVVQSNNFNICNLLVSHFRRCAREWAAGVDNSKSSVFIQGPRAFQPKARKKC
jgi:hypothetical protein